MFPAVGNTASCKIIAVIRFRHNKNMNAVEIDRKLCTAVYCKNVMSEGIVRQWCRMFTDEQANAEDEE
jgi:hypothetical protein